MPLDPCGWAVDYLRSAYRTQMRFGPYVGGQYTPLVYWYRCQDGVPAIPGGTIYGSTIWGNVGDYVPGQTLGEFYPFNRVWRHWDRPFDYGHLPCGLEFLRGGVPPFPGDLQPGLSLRDCCRPPGPQPPPANYPPRSVSCMDVGTLNLSATPPGGLPPPFTLFYDRGLSSPGSSCVWLGAGYPGFPLTFTRFRLLNAGFGGWVADFALMPLFGTVPIWYMSIPSYPAGPSPYVWTFVNGWPTFGSFPSGLTVATT